MRAWVAVCLGLVGCGGSDDSNQVKGAADAGAETADAPELAGELGDPCSEDTACSALAAVCRDSEAGHVCVNPVCHDGVCTFACPPGVQNFDPAAVCVSLGGTCGEGADGSWFCSAQ